MRIKRNIFFIASVLYVSASAGQMQADFSIPPPSVETKSTLQLWATHYFVHTASSSHGGVPFRNKTGMVISDNVTPKDWCLAAVEGTVQVKLRDSLQTLNYGGTGSARYVDCAAVLRINSLSNPWIKSVGKSYFTKAAGPYGDGVKGYRLVPLRTIAVDRGTIPYGTVIFVPKAKGADVSLPSGATIKHDGYFFAGDTGGAIKGPHVDIFCGVTEKNCLPSFVMNNDASKFEAILVTDEPIIRQLTAIHKS